MPARRAANSRRCDNTATMVRLLLVAALLLACNKPPGNDRPGASGLEAGSPCTLNAECRAGLICDPARRRCVCTGDDACPARTFCHPHTGLCVGDRPGCGRDEDCPEGQYCELESRTCRHGSGFCQPCTRDGECAERGARCLEGGFCGRACRVDGDCGERARCLDGQCRPMLRCWELATGKRTGHCVDTCREDADCGDGHEGCEYSLCLPRIDCDDLAPCVPDSLRPCQTDADCIHGVDQVCEWGLCVARRSGCAHSEACDPLTLACVPSCREDADCPRGRTCRLGACHPTGRCESDSQCPEGMVCACPRGATCGGASGEGECRPSCRHDDDCPLGQVCVESFGQKACRPGCTSDRDCGPEERCLVSVGVCLKEILACKFTELCPPCHLCRDGTCQPARRPGSPHCQSCETDSDCGEGGVCWQGHCAVSCGTEGCPNGFGCTRKPGADGVTRSVCVPVDGSCDTECL